MGIRGLLRNHPKMWEEYDSWIKTICDECDAGMKIADKPDYLCEEFLMTSDTLHKKGYEPGAATGKKFWKKFGTVKAAITDS